MLSIMDAQEKIHWCAINVGKIEQDMRLQMQEDAKKKKEQDDAQVRDL